MCWLIIGTIHTQIPYYFNNIYTYNGNYTLGMTIIDNGSGYVGYGATDDVGIYQMLFLYEISYTGEMQILKTYYELNTTFYPGIVGGAMIETWDGKLALAYHYSLFDESYGALMKLDNNLDTIWKKSYTPSYKTASLNCYETSDKGYLLTGWVFQSEEDFSDALLLKTDSMGNYQWHHLYGGYWAEHGTNVIETPDGGFLLGGYFWKPGYDHSQDAMVIKTDSLGNEEWTKYYGNPDVDDDMALVAMADDGNFLVATVYGVNSTSNSDRRGRTWFLKIDNDGEIIEDVKIGDVNRSQWIKNFRKTENGYIASGFFVDSTFISYKGFLLKIDENLDSIWMRKYSHFNELYDNNLFYDAYPTTDNGYIAIGKARPDGGGQSNKMWIVKVDSMGCDTPGCATGTFVEELFPYVRDRGEELMIWPNPAREEFWVTPLVFPPNGGMPTHIVVYNSQGVKVKEIPVPEDDETVTVNVQGLNRGMYFVRLTAGGRSLGSGKVVVK